MPPRRRNPFDRFNQAALAPLRIKSRKREPVELPVTAHRRYVLDQIDGGRVRWRQFGGWWLDGTACNAVIADFERAEWVDIDRVTAERCRIALTELGRTKLYDNDADL